MTVLVGLVPMLAENSLFKLIGEIFHPLFVIIATVLAYIYAVIPNYAVSIIVLTILIMAVLTPLTIKSTRSMMAMQALQPELQKLRQKYKGPENREQLNKEMMRLYREQGVSPTGGCLPMLIQMPALLVLYDIIRGLTNTVSKGQVISYTGKKCLAKVCADPRYIPSTSKMHADLVATPGIMKSFGLNLAIKPLTHQAHWFGYIPYMVLVALAVGLQYFQMSQMTKRNKAAAQMNQQMQTMQKVMPLIMAYIYFLVPVGAMLYMIVSSAIRILTQDLMFRTGMVQQVGAREISGGKSADQAGSSKSGQGKPAKGIVGQGNARANAGQGKPASTRPGARNAGTAATGGGSAEGKAGGRPDASAAGSAAAGGDGEDDKIAQPAGDGTSGDAGRAGGDSGSENSAGSKAPRAKTNGQAPKVPGARQAASNGRRRGGSGVRSPSAGKSNGSGAGNAAGNAAGQQDQPTKAHPRSKSKRTRKAR
ncbi:MAG: YidC/Oxa1 family membrane protein insertase [Actinomycetota bacterium]|jgi:YidC/Oxa1 family membrane protein insertase|nr:YidC/Oxa1 family membrane protein insertase [Actinomycetota bacterium]